ncbi:MAG: pyruvate dehydrogenase (acetyl-transferring), homodimeric type [Rhodomicrobium sp.]
MTTAQDDSLSDAATEIQEWTDAISSVIAFEGPQRADAILDRVVVAARHSGAKLPFAANTAYMNTIPPDEEPAHPGDRAIERRIKSAVRWNAIATVLKANKESSELGGHIASFQSAATLYDTGFMHFWQGAEGAHGGDLIYIQGHSSPGIYALAFLEGRLTEEQMLNFRQETGGKGLPSYPHPWLLPGFWQFPTVSMGLGPLMAIYQARFLRYLEGRGLANTSERKVWAFMGDGEMDEPESLGAISLAGREKLDNLIFVVNCNLQKLDGPVRGNGKIIQELEGDFRGSGWNVIKVVWGSNWDELLARDDRGKLRQLMEECVDGEYQTFKAKSGAYIREHFFGRYPETAAMVADWSDDRIWSLRRGGHDPQKMFAAYRAAVHHKGQPTVILAKTVKGYGMGEAGEGMMIAHQAKKMGMQALVQFRDRFQLPLTDQQLSELPFIRFEEGSPELTYLRERRAALGGALPKRRQKTSVSLTIPPLTAFEAQLKGSDGREVSTTMAFVQMLTKLMRDKNIGKRIVPIVPDESRTFGMEGMFRQFGIFSQVGQLYNPQDADQLMYYKEDKHGQVLEEGINEAGAMASWIAAATSYSASNEPMIPFYVYYSMFGFQRTGDLAWAAGDMRARGFLIGGTSGRTTLNGEGLQHEDGHSHLISATIPNCISYDPAFGYEVAVIVQDGLRRMYGDQEDVYYYITTLNENYVHPPMPEGAEEGIVKGMYLLKPSNAETGHKVRLLGSGAILREVIAGAGLLEKDFGIAADIWSVTSFTELRREALDVERWNMLHPEEETRVSYVSQCLPDGGGPVVASTDYMKLFADQIRPFVMGNYRVLGTDGFGRSDYRRKLRSFFEVDRHYVAVAALKALADENKIPSAKVTEAIQKYSIDTERPSPARV